MNYEPARDPHELIQRLLRDSCKTGANTANALAGLRSQYGASHEHLEALIQLGFLRLGQALAAAAHLQLDEMTRQGEERQKMQASSHAATIALLREVIKNQRQSNQNISEALEVLTSIDQALFTLFVDSRRKSLEIFPQPGEAIGDPDDPEEVEAELRYRNGQPLDG